MSTRADAVRHPLFYWLGLGVQLCAAEAARCWGRTIVGTAVVQAPSLLRRLLPARTIP